MNEIKIHPTTTSPAWEGEIQLTPAYEHIFATMLREAKMRGEAQTLFDCLDTNHIRRDLRQTALALRAVQRFLAPLNIAAQCMTNREAVEHFREAINQIVQDINKTAAEREEFLAQQDED